MQPPGMSIALGLALAITLALALATPAANAQVNTEPFRAELDDDGLGGRLQATFVGRVGNTEGLTLGVAGLFGGRRKKHFAFVAGSLDYSRLSGATQLERYFTHGRYNYEILSFLLAEAFAQLEHDRFQRLTLRRLVGAGPRFELVEGQPVTLALGTAYMLERETLRQTEEFAEQHNTFHRSSSYATLLVRPDDRVSFATTTFFQPRFDRPSDFRLLNVDTLEFSVTKHLTASIGMTLRYDSRPPGGVERLDVVVKNALGLKY